VNGLSLTAGDALKVVESGDIVIESGRTAEILLFDLD